MKSATKATFFTLLLITMYSFLEYLIHVGANEFILILFDNIDYIFKSIISLMLQPLGLLTSLVAIVIIFNWKWVEHFLKKKLYLIKRIEIGKNKIIFNGAYNTSTEIAFKISEKDDIVEKLDYGSREDIEHIKYMIMNISRGSASILSYLAVEENVKSVSLMEMVYKMYYNSLKIDGKFHELRFKDLCSAVSVQLISLFNTNLISGKIKFPAGLEGGLDRVRVYDIFISETVKRAILELENQGMDFRPDIIWK
ncbi:MAG: hypothetical protein PHP06_06405 [Clostridia bacterium]|nr:hypothetical protein [Clostridia bacterium]